MKNFKKIDFIDICIENEIDGKYIISKNEYNIKINEILENKELLESKFNILLKGIKKYIRDNLKHNKNYYEYIEITSKAILNEYNLNKQERIKIEDLIKFENISDVIKDDFESDYGIGGTEYKQLEIPNNLKQFLKEILNLNGGLSFLKYKINNDKNGKFKYIIKEILLEIKDEIKTKKDIKEFLFPFKSLGHSSHYSGY
ncbi:MAG: hypothetical protein PHR68_02875 [Candidatus Gracilibacteria bacterium]|nr:hypothetical protein [Candidatus Gracilibacteria bacterium]